MLYTSDKHRARIYVIEDWNSKIAEARGYWAKKGSQYSQKRRRKLLKRDMLQELSEYNNRKGLT